MGNDVRRAEEVLRFALVAVHEPPAAHHPGEQPLDVPAAAMPTELRRSLEVVQRGELTSLTKHIAQERTRGWGVTGPLRS